MTVTIVGGDKKSLLIADHLRKNGINIRLCGLEKLIGEENIDLKHALKISDKILLPLPSSRDFVHIHTPFSDTELHLTDLAAFERPSDILSAGLPARFGFTDYYTDALQIGNAVPSAEGAIKLAIELHPKTLWGSSCAVVGFGRIGKILADRLKAFGADVTVTARRDTDLALASAYNLKNIKTESISNYAFNYDIIFNTVPHKVITRAVLQKMRGSAVVIDLASGEGGTDFAAAKEFGITAEHALSLPGKVAPKTAAELISKTVLPLLLESDNNE